MRFCLPPSTTSSIVVGTECFPSAMSCRFSFDSVVGFAEWSCTQRPRLPPNEFVQAVLGLSSIADGARASSDPGSADEEVAVTTPLPGAGGVKAGRAPQQLIEDRITRRRRYPRGAADPEDPGSGQGEFARHRQLGVGLERLLRVGPVARQHDRQWLARAVGAGGLEEVGRQAERLGRGDSGDVQLRQTHAALAVVAVERAVAGLDDLELDLREGPAREAHQLPGLRQGRGSHVDVDGRRRRAATGEGELGLRDRPGRRDVVGLHERHVVARHRLEQVDPQPLPAGVAERARPTRPSSCRRRRRRRAGRRGRN